MSAHDLREQAIRETLSIAVANSADVAATYREGNRWPTFHARLLHVEERAFFLSVPRADAIHCIRRAELGISFHNENARYATRAAVEDVESSREGEETATVKFAMPKRMRRVLPRVSRRCLVPSPGLARALFWPGGIDVEPSEQPDTPSWIGTVEDISIAGCRIRAHRDAGDLLVVHDLIGIMLSFSDLSSARTDGHLCFVGPAEGDEAHYGVSFAGLAERLEGKMALSMLAQKLEEFAA